MIQTDYLDLILFFTGGILASLIVNKLLLSFSQSLGIRNKNDVVIRWSNQSKPSLGGISMYFVFIFSIFVYAAVYGDDLIFQNNKFIGLLLAGTIAFAIGLADDAYNTKPLLKLSGQIAAGLVLVLTGTVIDLFHVFYLDAVVTIVWVIIIMNSLNMLDNMDGITGTVSFFILLTCMLSYFLFNGYEINFWIVLLIAQLGALVGFLRYNINPSLMFMGDTGSQFLALFVAFFAIEGLWNTSATREVPAWSGMLVVLAAFVPAAADTLTVVINRLKRGQSPMVGGKDHTTHHLVYKGFSDFKVWVFFLWLSMLSCLVAFLLIMNIEKGAYLISIIGLFYFLIVFFYLFRITKKYKQPK